MGQLVVGILVCMMAGMIPNMVAAHLRVVTTGCHSTLAHKSSGIGARNPIDQVDAHSDGAHGRREKRQ